MVKKLVVPYEGPDLDGTACAYAYAEFLQQQGEDAIYGVFGTPYKEARFVLEHLDLELNDAADLLDEADEIAVVDASDLRGISDRIDHEDVTEIIDHREEHHAEEFPNADAQIELVGAAATLIAEKFHDNDIDPSEESAVLLYTAIISNTMNFQANVTTERDRSMADWLEPYTDLKDDFIHRMFEHKSEINEPLEDVFIAEFATESYDDERIGIVQLEIVDVDSFVDGRKEDILETLQELGEEKGLDHIFLTCADLEDGFNRLVTPYEETQRLLSAALDVHFEGSTARRGDVLLRKEIIPHLRDELLETG